MAQKKEKDTAPKKATVQKAATKKTSTAKTAPKQTVAVGSKTEVLKNHFKTYAKLYYVGAGLLVVLIACLITLFCIWGANGAFANPYANTSKVGYYAEYLGTVDRNIPTETKNEGKVADDRYPVFGYSVKNITAEEKAGLIAEARILMAYGTKEGGATPKSSYNMMDENGNLFMVSSDGTKTAGYPTKLYKHTASKNMWYGEVSDEEPALIKRVTIQPRSVGNHITGLYAPAGEIIKIEISESDLNSVGGLVVDIGQAFPNGKSNNIWAARGDFSRMPVILNSMAVNKNTATLKDGVYTAYVGSFLGGPIYLKPSSRVKFTATISGAVAYNHYILGYTTEEEFEKNAATSTPYFDMEVWDRGVRISGGKKYATKVDGKALTYENLYDASIYWQKVMSVSTQIPTGSSAGTGIVYLYEPFVAAGGLVAFVGQNVVNAPPGYMSNALDYDAMVNRGYDGLWGNMHELNHHFQNGWGLPAAGEVSNNAVSLVSYSLFTNISANRALGNGNEGNWAVGWDRYTNPSWSLRQTFAHASANAGLDAYSTLLHNFGQDLFIAAAQQRGGRDFNAYYNAWSKVTGNDMSFFFNDVLHSGINAAIDKDKPMFVPVASIYQTGRSIMTKGAESYEKTYIQTAQPYAIKAGEDFIVDLRKYVSNDDGTHNHGTIVLPDGFSYKIKNITNPQYGRIAKYKDENNKEVENVYIYRPDKKQLKSGEIRVTLEITKDDAAFTVDDVDLVLQFRQDHEMNKSVLTRTIYTYSADKLPTTAQEAYESSYAGHESKTEMDSKNPTQNTNFDIWVPNGATTGLEAGTKSVMEVYGKIRVPQAGRYRIALRGRHSAALYISTDGGKNYELAAVRNHNTHANGFDLKDPNAYKDLEFTESTWLYVKEVLLVDYDSAFIGIGWGQFVAPQFTIQVDGDGNTHYIDANGNEVTEEEANNAQETVSVSYVNGYRSTYEIHDEKFVTPDYYPKKYAFTYNEVYADVQNKTTVVSGGECAEGRDLSNGFDGNMSTSVVGSKPLSEAPFEALVDIGQEIKANMFTFYGFNQGRDFVPVSFSLYAGTNQDDLSLIDTYENLTPTGRNVSVTFDTRNVRYYKIVITEMNNSTVNRWAAFAEARFSMSVEGTGRLYSPDVDTFKYWGNWKLENKLCTFGHVYSGGNGANVNFEFTGTYFVINSYKYANAGQLEISIDGVAVETVSLKSDKEGTAVVFVSARLSEGKHSVNIKCVGNANIDSIALWEAES